jgi:ABC-type sugar transport system permease subunit
MSKRVAAAALSYLVPTFLLGFVWHLVLFKAYYDALAIYRRDVIIGFGLMSMAIQALLFAWIYDRSFATAAGNTLRRGLAYALFGAALSWSFTTIAVAAKNMMSSVPDYLLIETAFTAVQWAIVGPVTAVVSAHLTLDPNALCRSARLDSRGERS